MRRLFILLFLFVSCPVYSDGPKLENAQWACPSEVKVQGKIYKIDLVSVFDGLPGNLMQLAPERGIYAFRHLDRLDIYLVCEYKGLKQSILIHAKGATFCGHRKNAPLSCWAGPSP